jgi:nucleoside-diphosphate-sugar epimerase
MSRDYYIPHYCVLQIVRRFFSFTQMPVVPALQLALVDVVDVAKAHILAMQCAKSDGQRILLTAQPSFWFRDLAKALAKEFRKQGMSNYGIRKMCKIMPNCAKPSNFQATICHAMRRPITLFGSILSWMLRRLKC